MSKHLFAKNSEFSSPPRIKRVYPHYGTRFTAGKWERSTNDPTVTFGCTSETQDRSYLCNDCLHDVTLKKEKEMTIKQQNIVKKMEDLKKSVIQHVRVSERTCEFWSDKLLAERRVAAKSFAKKRLHIICMEERLKRLKTCANEMFTGIFPPKESGFMGELEREKVATHLMDTIPEHTTTNVSETETVDGGTDMSDSEQ